MDKVVKPDRGRVCQCTICDFLGERKTALKHFRTKHVTADEEQYRSNISVTKEAWLILQASQCAQRGIYESW